MLAKISAPQSISTKPCGVSSTVTFAKVAMKARPGLNSASKDHARAVGTVKTFDRVG